MKALILSANIGGGHTSCAKAIQDVFISHDEQCDIQDVLTLISKEVSKATSSGQIFIYRHAPWIINVGYKGREKKANNIFNKTSFLYKFLTLGVPRLYSLIKTNGYDTIICTHVFSALIVTAMQEKYKLPLLTCQIATDYDCSGNAKDTKIDYYFIPDEKLIEEFVDFGIPKEKIFASGIPVNKDFFQSLDKEKTKESLGIPKESKHLLMMGGSMGSGPLLKVAHLLIKNLKDNNYLSVVCGSNKELYRNLSFSFQNNPNVHIYGLTKQMPLLMHSADLLLTKPGGLTTTEAYASHLPMVLFDFIGGYETDNANFFTGIGGAISEKDPKLIIEQAISLLNNPSKLKEMTSALAASSQNRDLPENFIYNFLKEEYSKRFIKQLL